MLSRHYAMARTKYCYFRKIGHTAIFTNEVQQTEPTMESLHVQQFIVDFTASLACGQTWEINAPENGNENWKRIISSTICS